MPRRLDEAAERSEACGVPTRGYRFDPDDANRRVFLVFNLDPIFIDLIQRPIALQFVHAALGPNWIISNFSANITGPGSGAMGLHADQGYAVPPWPATPLAVNVGWVLDDDTPEVGATRYVPGSHLLGHGPEAGGTLWRARRLRRASGTASRPRPGRSRCGPPRRGPAGSGPDRWRAS